MAFIHPKLLLAACVVEKWGRVVVIV